MNVLPVTRFQQDLVTEFVELALWESMVLGCQANGDIYTTINDLDDIGGLNIHQGLNRWLVMITERGRNAQL